MTEKHENRRVRMTKRLMKDALLELLEKEELVNISVTAICKTADVHRSTFSDYYKDPADLLRETKQDFLERIPAPPPIADMHSCQRTVILVKYLSFTNSKGKLSEELSAHERKAKLKPGSDTGEKKDER